MRYRALKIAVGGRKDSYIDRDPPNAADGADLFLLPSRCDSFGFVFLEAMSQGAVCIGSRLNAMPEIIEDGVTGFIVEPGDDGELARQIVNFYRTPGLRASFGRSAIERVHDRFTWPQVGAMILSGLQMGRARPPRTPGA